MLLTTEDAVVGATARDVVWTHRGDDALPLQLIAAAVCGPAAARVRAHQPARRSSTCGPGSSLIEYLLDEGFDVFLLDWGSPDEEDADMGLDEYVCDELHWGVRETLRASGADELTLLGWCIGATLCAMYCGLDPTPERPSGRRQRGAQPRAADDAGRGARLDVRHWVGHPEFDPERWPSSGASLPGGAIDFANKLLKPVTNFFTTYRRLWEGDEAGQARREAYQPMAKWVADNPAFPGPRLGAVDRDDVPAGRLVAGRARGCAGAAWTSAGSTRTCWSSRPAPTTSPRARARCRCSSWSPART